MLEPSEKKYAVRSLMGNVLASFDTEEEGIFYAVNHGYKYWCGNCWDYPGAGPNTTDPEPSVYLSYQKEKTVKRMIKKSILPRDVMLHPE